MSSAPTEDVLVRHRKELRDLQALVTQKKKSATKKSRKAVNAECERLERELRERQHLELHPDEAADHTAYIPPPSPEPESASTPATTDTSKPTTPTPSTQEEPRLKKPSRQKARLARRADALLASAAEAELEASLQPNLRDAELTTMSTLLATHKLREHPIAPDGHCLYNAFAHAVDEPAGYKLTRTKCAEYIRSHPDDFSAFLENGTVEELAGRVEGTAEWGGQLEVMALAKAYGVTVRVLQGEGRVEVMGEGEAEVWLAYYRHSYGLGEHYNALEKIDAP